MAKIKKYAKGGSYYVDVKEPSKVFIPKDKPIVKPNIEGWNIPVINSNK